MKCKIQWIDSDGKPTPDDNEAVAFVQATGNGVLLGDGHPSPICAEHLARMKARHVSWPGTPLEVVTEWKIVGYPPGKDPKLAQIRALVEEA